MGFPAKKVSGPTLPYPTSRSKRCKWKTYIEPHLGSVVRLSHVDQGTVPLLKQDLDTEHVSIHPQHVEDAVNLGQLN